jgi:hypothetical protein
MTMQPPSTGQDPVVVTIPQNKTSKVAVYLLHGVLAHAIEALRDWTHLQLYLPSASLVNALHVEMG